MKSTLLVTLAVTTAACSPPTLEPSARAVLADSGKYPWHTNIVATTFWVGEIFDPQAQDGSQAYSTYDSAWIQSYGGCDGISAGGVCTTEVRVQSNGYAPTRMTPSENPFYLDLPYDDINNAAAFRERAGVIPWANEAAYAGRGPDASFSYMKNRWVRMRNGDRECYGQIQDAGPGQYQDKAYVFGANDTRPANKDFNGAGMDVSPALNGCLGFKELNGRDDRVNWQFVDDKDVPSGPWKTIVTTRQVR
ncbi:hypothetical protein [Arthrobacter agilis]|uniref:hypothetical protein n=1 Tax=Arthrobacter agilis TaxID=37921 RepID=UPI0027D7F545|nr:hypothetical protein [Arthrobacter agilis]